MRAGHYGKTEVTLYGSTLPWEGLLQDDDINRKNDVTESRNIGQLIETPEFS